MKKDTINRRNTKQRDIVFNSVTSRCDHPTADEIYLEINKENPHISKGTVYRNLNILSKNGKISHIKVPGSDRFDLRLDNHYHIICTECGKVVDAPIEYEKEEDSIVSKSTGFEIKRHRTVFEGICPECKKSLLKTE